MMGREQTVIRERLKVYPTHQQKLSADWVILWQHKMNGLFCFGFDCSHRLCWHASTCRLVCSSVVMIPLFPTPLHCSPSPPLPTLRCGLSGSHHSGSSRARGSRLSASPDLHRSPLSAAGPSPSPSPGPSQEGHTHTRRKRAEDRPSLTEPPSLSGCGWVGCVCGIVCVCVCLSLCLCIYVCVCVIFMWALCPLTPVHLSAQRSHIHTLWLTLVGLLWTNSSRFKRVYVPKMLWNMQQH